MCIVVVDVEKGRAFLSVQNAFLEAFRRQDRDHPHTTMRSTVPIVRKWHFYSREQEVLWYSGIADSSYYHVKFVSLYKNDTIEQVLLDPPGVYIFP